MSAGRLKITACSLTPEEARLLAQPEGRRLFGWNISSPTAQAIRSAGVAFLCKADVFWLETALGGYERQSQGVLGGPS